jgi:hypothetical protein
VINVFQITASTVNDLTKQIDDMPESIDTVVLELSRATVSETNIGLHSTHLLADALLDACELGQLTSRIGTRKLRSEEGNILGGRKLICYYTPKANAYIDWLATNLNSQGHFACYEQNTDQGVRLWYGNIGMMNNSPNDFDANGVGAYETFAVNDHYYLTLMSNWLTANTPRGQAVVEFNQLIQKPSHAVKP